MGILNPSPESGFISSIEQLLVRRSEVIKTSTNAVEGVYVQLYKAGAYLADKASSNPASNHENQSVDESNHVSPQEINDNEPYENNVTSLDEHQEAKRKQQLLEQQSREIARRLAA